MQSSLSLQKAHLTLKRLNLTVIHLQCLFTLYDTVCDGRHIIMGTLPDILSDTWSFVGPRQESDPWAPCIFKLYRMPYVITVFTRIHTLERPYLVYESFHSRKGTWTDYAVYMHSSGRPSLSTHWTKVAEIGKYWKMRNGLRFLELCMHMTKW